MTFGVAIVLFAVFAAAFILSAVLLKSKRKLRAVLMVATGLLAAAFLVYCGLTLILVDAVRSSPPSA